MQYTIFLLRTLEKHTILFRGLRSMLLLLH